MFKPDIDLVFIVDFDSEEIGREYMNFCSYVTGKYKDLWPVESIKLASKYLNEENQPCGMLCIEHIDLVGYDDCDDFSPADLYATPNTEQTFKIVEEEDVNDYSTLETLNELTDIDYLTIPIYSSIGLFLNRMPNGKELEILKRRALKFVKDTTYKIIKFRIYSEKQNKTLEEIYV